MELKNKYNMPDITEDDLSMDLLTIPCKTKLHNNKTETSKRRLHMLHSHWVDMDTIEPSFE